MDKLISTKRLYEKVSEIEEIIKNRLVHLGTEDPFYQVHLAQFNDWTAFKKMIFDEPEVKDGKLLELPCKPGDTVYVISKYTKYDTQIIEATVTLMKIKDDGKTVFLSKPEAQAALEGMKHAE